MWSTGRSGGSRSPTTPTPKTQTPSGTGFDYTQFEGIKTVEGSPAVGNGVEVTLPWDHTDRVHPLTKDFFQNSITGKGIDIGPYNWTADAGHYVKLTLEDNNADESADPLYGPVGGTVTLPTPVKTGSNFLGWFESEDLSGTAVVSPYTITESGKTLYAKWEKQAGKVNVVFDSQGGSEVAPQNGLDEGTKVARPAADPTRDGYKFLGWYKEAAGTEAWDFVNDTVTEDLTLYAKWQKLLTVTFDTQGGSEVPAQGNLDSGAKAAKPANPTKAGYRFLGWYKQADGTEAWDFNTDTVTADTTLYAKWEKLFYTVTFDKNEGDTEANPATMQVSPPVTTLSGLPTEPTREGYAFTGWNTKADGSGDTFTVKTEVTADITVYAQWTEIVTFTVTYDANGGTGVSPAQQEVAAGEAVEPIDIPSADYGTKLSVMLNGGSDVDVFWVKDADTIYPIAKRGQMADMSSFIARDGMDLGTYNGLAENFNIDGQQIGIPFRTDYYVLFYNKDIFDAAGVEYPSNDMTWSEFEELAKKVTMGEGVDKKYGAFFHTWQACVENWAVQDGQHTIMDTDYSFFKPYYEMVLRMQNDDQTCMDYGTVKTANLHYSGVFSDGSVAMMPMGTWFAATMIDKINKGESSVNWGIATLPHPDNVEAGYVVGATTPIAINAASPNQDLAWEFVKFVCGPEGAAVVANCGGVPALLNDDTLKVISSVDGYPEGALEALQVKNIALDRPIADKVSEVNNMLGEQHSLIMLGESDLDTVLADMGSQSKSIQG